MKSRSCGSSSSCCGRNRGGSGCGRVAVPLHTENKMGPWTHNSRVDIVTWKGFHDISQTDRFRQLTPATTKSKHTGNLRPIDLLITGLNLHWRGNVVMRCFTFYVSKRRSRYVLICSKNHLNACLNADLLANSAQIDIYLFFFRDYI